MQANSRDRKHGNDGSPYLRRKPRFTSGTTGIRLRPEQQEWVRSELEKDPEETFSRMVRLGLNLLKKEREGLIQALTPERR